MRKHRAPITLRDLLGTISFLGLAVLLQGATTQMEAAFSVPGSLISTPQDSSDQQVATSGANVFVVWRDNEIGAAVFNPEIYFTRSIDGGKTFGSFQNISQSSGTYGTGNPRIAANGSHVYLVFNDTGGDFLVHSDDGGATFLPKVNLTTAFGLQLGSSSWLAAAGSNLYMVWRQNTGGADDIFLARFGNYGASFLGVQNISLSTAYSIDPKVVASGNTVYVAWSEPVGSANDILFRRSVDGGVAFDLTLNISSNAGLSRNPSLDADGMNVWLAWKDNTPGNDDIMFARSINAGGSFEPLVLNLSSNSSGSIDPAVAGRGSNVYVTWADVPPGAASNQRDVYLRKSEDAGAAFDANQNLSGSTLILSGVPRTAVSDSVVSVYWGESIPVGIGTQRDIFYVYQELSVPIPPPSMLSLSPSSGIQTQSVDVDLTGAGFQNGAIWQISGTEVTLSDVEFVSATAMKGKMNVALNAAPGGRNLTVTNPDGQSATLMGAFTVMSASALMLIEITRTDVNMGVGGGGFLSGSSSYKSLLAHLDNAEKALLQQPADLATAINQMDAFYIKIGNLAKGKKPEITQALYTTLYNDYAAVMNSLGGTVKPAQ
ncbi:MAG: hypothetical protein L0387_07055 [Acidobacteria bacterium]|nr:hypothetical protein [Acidobacteriota bacterium]MCI0724432.1 hypothetical protein [Acidobacteriota bacterium]